jgi:hypothetical protein
MAGPTTQKFVEKDFRYTMRKGIGKHKHSCSESDRRAEKNGATSLPDKIAKAYDK